MQTAKDLQAQIKKCEAKAKTCKYPSTRKIHEDKAAFLKGELRLQLLWEAAGKPKPKAEPKPKLALPSPAEEPPPKVLIPEIMPPIGTPVPQAGSIKDFVVEILPPLIVLAFLGGWWIILMIIAFSVASYWQDTQRRTHP
jgi:hypothetical protein